MKALETALLVLIRPRRAFQRLAEGQRKVWLVTLILIIAATLVQVTISIPYVIEMQNDILREQGFTIGVEAEEDGSSSSRSNKDAEMQEEGPTLPAEAQDAIQTAAVVSSFVFTPLGLVAAALFVAALLLVAAKALGGEGTFGPAFSMYVLTLMPGAVRALVQSAYMTLSGKWVPHQGLSALVATETSTIKPTPLYAFLSVIDIYFIWQLVLLTVGLVIVFRLPRKRALIIVAAFAALTFIMTVVPALISSALVPAAMG